VLPFVSDLDEKILSTIDKIYTKYPYYGHRRVHKLLGRLGLTPLITSMFIPIKIHIYK